ncbi:MAG: flavodoxin family protein, partial [Candidatus Peribacteraceae bacterium]|nr:flavodoxin family protein [Candidatus Peribacteraceae bacterium]
RKRNTYYLVSVALRECEKRGIKTELLHIGKMHIAPCNSCDGCSGGKDCVIEDDLQEVAGKIEKSDGLILGSPVYFGGVSAQMKAFMDRTRPLRKRKSMADKVGGAIAVGGSRQGGQEFTINQIHNFFLIHGMIVVGDEDTMHFGGMAVGSVGKDAENDTDGKETSINLGKHVARVLKNFKPTS